MEWRKPAFATLWRAIGTYLRIAYDGDAGSPGGIPSGTPSPVRAKLQVIRSTEEHELFDSNVFERDPSPTAPVAHNHSPHPAPAGGQPQRPKRYYLPLGNRNYPHMKMVVDRTPDGHGFLFRADTHDNHVRPKPGSRDEKPFLELMERNRVVAEAIETAWEQDGLPTFKKFLREDLERRKAQAAAAAAAQVPKGA